MELFISPLFASVFLCVQCIVTVVFGFGPKGTITLGGRQKIVGVSVLFLVFVCVYGAVYVIIPLIFHLLPPLFIFQKYYIRHPLARVPYAFFCLLSHIKDDIIFVASEFVEKWSREFYCEYLHCGYADCIV